MLLVQRRREPRGGKAAKDGGAGLRNPVGNGAAGAGVGHGFGPPPEMIPEVLGAQRQPVILRLEVAQRQAAASRLGEQRRPFARTIEKKLARRAAAS